MEYYLATKMDGLLPFTTTRMELEGIMLSEITLTKKDKYHTINVSPTEDFPLNL